MKNALLFGGTGLIGNSLLRRIVDNPHYAITKAFTRRNIRIKNLNVEVHQIDFDKIEESARLMTGDDCFCCLGTTMNKVKTREAFRNVDFGLVVKIAEIASKNGVRSFIVVSSLGANASSSNFYLRTKGEMEEAIQKIPFEKICIVRPSILIGRRGEFRIGESVGILFSRLLSPLMLGPLRKYKPIKTKTLVKAMMKLANTNQKKIIFESDELQELGRV